MATGSEKGLTDQQRRAVQARGVSVALAAGAGCGKTFVLTERFLAQLQPDGPDAAGGTRLGQVVAITFTERAAREMRDRIRQACAQRLVEAPEDQADYWLEVIRELDTARISTIHSFCGSLLRAHAVETGLDPQFRVLDQAQADTLLYELLDQQLRDRLAQRDEPVVELVVQFGLEGLYERIRGLLGRRQEIDWPQWRAETPGGLVVRWQDYWQADTLPRVLSGVADSPAAQTVLQIAEQHPPSNTTMRQRCEVLLKELPELAERDAPASDLASIRRAAQVRGGGGKKAWQSEEIYHRFRDAAGRLRKAVDQAEEFMGFDREAALPAAETALRLLGVAAAVAEAYDQQKQQQGVLDFDDLLIRTRQLLLGPDRQDLRKRLASHIRLLLVDEFQDTDPVQVELVEALCDDELTRGKLFFVGDYKQSIYRFRGADPQVYRRLRAKLPSRGRLPLSLNFRSQPAVLDFVNALFHGELGPEYEPLRPDRRQVGPTPAVEFLWAADAAEDDSDDQPSDLGGGDSGGRLPASGDVLPQAVGETERVRRLEADRIARRVRAMLDSGEKIVRDETAPREQPAVRPVRPGDIALLFRALSNVELYEEPLRRYGIDYYLVGGHAFYAQQEIYDVVNLLRAISSPCDEVSLAGVLRSPMFNLLDETLFWLARHPGGLSAGLLAEDLPDELDGEQRRRVQFAAATLGELRAMKDRVPIAQLISEAVARTGYDAVLLVEFLGERKLANLRKLIEQARSFDRSGMFTLSEFITQLTQFVARQPDEPLAATQPESTDVVRLMTVHQAKGLEFPVVIVPDVDRRARGSTASVAFTRRLGPMVKHVGPISGFDLHMLAERDEDQAELVRLLYVATTRAADYLILSAGLRQLGSASGPWMELLKRRFDPETGKARVGNGEVMAKVTTTRPPLKSRPSGGPRRRDLKKLADRARQTAAGGKGRVPQYLAPVAPDPQARRQYSFSRLTGAVHDETRVPASSPGEQPGPPAVDPLGLGTLVHAVLAEVDFAQPGDVPALVSRHAQRHLPRAGEELDEAIQMIERFLGSLRAEDIAAAKQVHRELEFLLAWPPEGNEPGGRYIEGFIDCLYRDATGEWRVVDYKTNQVTESTVAEVARHYEMQMLLYALAVEQILDCPPNGLVLHFLRPGLEYHFKWDTAARRQARELVDEAMQKAATGGRGFANACA